MGEKSGKKRKYPKKIIEEEAEEQVQLPPLKRSSDEPIPKKTKWTNRQRLMIMAARGITYRDRHLLKDLQTFLPHCRTDNKLEKKNLFVVNEMCVMRHCNKALILEARLHRDLYMWLANTPNGPSAKFQIENVHTLGELKMTGNCLKGTRPLLSFDKLFDEEPHYQLLKELLIQIFGTPNGHPKSQPFFDHVLTFCINDNRIWFRNYQILGEDGALAEVGPRFVMNPIKIFDGSFTGATLWENPHYITPAVHRKVLRKQASVAKYANRAGEKVRRELTKPKETYSFDANELFTGDVYEKAQEIIQKKEESVRKEAPQRKKREVVKRKVRTSKNMENGMSTGDGNQKPVEVFPKEVETQKKKVLKKGVPPKAAGKRTVASVKAEVEKQKQEKKARRALILKKRAAIAAKRPQKRKSRPLSLKKLLDANKKERRENLIEEHSKSINL